MEIEAGRTYKVRGGRGFPGGTLVLIHGTEDEGETFDATILVRVRGVREEFESPYLGYLRRDQIGEQVPTPHQLISV